MVSIEYLGRLFMAPNDGSIISVFEKSFIYSRLTWHSFKRNRLTYLIFSDEKRFEISVKDPIG